jgi:membrane fusion protein (multidrug efflux system)
MLDAEYSESGLESHFDLSSSGFGRYETAPHAPKPAPKPEPRPERDATPPKAKEADDKNEGEGKEKEQDKEEKSSPGFVRRHPALALATVALAALAAGAGYIYYEDAGHYESTDDAFIAARQTSIAPKVTAYVTTVPVNDNQHVNAGDAIAKLDDRDYQIALDQAEAQVASAKASIANAEAQTDVQNAQIESAKAQVEQARAALAFAQQQASRYDQLAKTGSGTVQNAQQYTSQLGQQEATLKSAQAAERVAERQLEALKAQRQSAEASLSTANAQREQALLNLSYTNVKATEPGRIVSLSAEPGELAQPGTALAMFVPDALWIVANFKETQLDRMRPGQPVSFTIDAYPERELKGRVDSVQPGSGTAFSLLPAQNATGNYVKVVQRVPVKIVLDNPPPDVALGPGMSVEPSVRVDPSLSYWERLTAAYDRFWGRP